MTKYYTDFSEYTTDVAPSDWTRHFGSRTYLVRDVVGVEGGKVLEVTGAADFDFFVWDAINADAERDDSEVLFKFRVTGLSSELRALQRGVDNTGREGYIWGARPDSGSFNGSYLQGGTFNDLASTTQPTFVVDTWYWCSSIIRGGTQELRFWEDGGTRPVSADISASDVALSAAGWIGLYSNRTDTVEVDVFAVGTGADDAPTSAPVGTEGLPAYTLHKNGATLGNLSNVRVRVTASSALNGTEYYYSATVSATAGVLPAIDLSATAATVGDTVTVELLTGANEGAVFEDLVEDIS